MLNATKIDTDGSDFRPNACYLSRDMSDFIESILKSWYTSCETRINTHTYMQMYRISVDKIAVSGRNMEQFACFHLRV